MVGSSSSELMLLVLFDMRYELIHFIVLSKFLARLIDSQIYNVISSIVSHALTHHHQEEARNIDLEK